MPPVPMYSGTVGQDELVGITERKAPLTSRHEKDSSSQVWDTRLVKLDSRHTYSSFSSLLVRRRVSRVYLKMLDEGRVRQLVRKGAEAGRLRRTPKSQNLSHKQQFHPSKEEI